MVPSVALDSVGPHKIRANARKIAEELSMNIPSGDKLVP